MTIYRADMLSAQQNFILRRNLQVSFEQEKERFGCKERKSFVNTEMLVFIIEIIGTVAFASSGAMVGIRKKMDVLGVIVMADRCRGRNYQGSSAGHSPAEYLQKPDLCRVFGSDSGDTFCCFLYQKTNA